MFGFCFSLISIYFCDESTSDPKALQLGNFLQLGYLMAKTERFRASFYPDSLSERNKLVPVIKESASV